MASPSTENQTELENGLTNNAEDRILTTVDRIFHTVRSSTPLKTQLGLAVERETSSHPRILALFANNFLA